MRKLTRKNLDDLAATMPVISEDEQRRYVGGADNTYYFNSDGTYYVTGSDGTIYGYIPEVTVTALAGGTYYRNYGEFEGRNDMSPALQFMNALVGYTPFGNVIDFINDITGYGARNDHTTDMVRRNLENCSYRMDQGFYLRSEYVQGEGMCTVIYSDSNSQRIGYFRNY
jgi:hypothetical protein